MLHTLRETLESTVGDIGIRDQLEREVSRESVAPDAIVRAIGDPVHEVLVVECGLFSVAAPGEPPQWATEGAIIGLAASLTGAPSKVAVTAVRFGRVARVPMQALWQRDGETHVPVATIARLAQLPDQGLHTLPPDPLVITVLLESCGDMLEVSLARQLIEAVRTLNGWALGHTTTADAALGLSDELAAMEAGAQTVVHVVRGSNGERAAQLVAHADRVLVFQPMAMSTKGSAALAAACSDSTRRHTELVVVQAKREATEAPTRQFQAPPRVSRVHLLANPSPVQLQTLLAELRRSAREHEALRAFDVFRTLSERELAWVQSQLRWERVDGGSLLLQQGDKAADAWLVRAGRLQEVRTTNAGERHVAWCAPGDMVGQDELLRGGTRSTSVRAVRDSTVARLDREAFEALLERSAGFSSAIALQIAQRAAGDIIGARSRSRTVAVVPLASPERVRQLVDAFVTACEEGGTSATVVDTARLDASLGAQASATRRGDAGDGRIIDWLDELERQYDSVLLVCSGSSDSWSRRAIRQCDYLLLVADGTTDPALRPIEHELLDRATEPSGSARAVTADHALGFTGEPHLVLLQPNGTSEASGTAAWLTLRPHHVHHHVRADQRGDVARLARRLTGSAVALALSGGSSRAPAHFGVVRAMLDLGLPIDITSGSSSGAGVAALVASGMPGEEGLARGITIIATGSPRLSQFQPPITSLTSGAAADRALQEVFGDRQLEDQWIPAVLTAVDIRRHRAVHLTRGPIWKLVRASGSLPLLWPPVWHEGDLLVDGGIINHLPADVFAGQTENGLVVASNLDTSAGQGAPAFEGTLDYGTTMSSWGELVRRISRSKAPTPPGLIDILFHTMSIPSFQHQEGLSALVERGNMCMLTPPIGAFGLFEVDAKIGRQLEAISWQYARSALKDVAARWHAQLEWRVPT